MNFYTLRLQPGNDLKNELLNFIKNKNIRAGLILTCVGSLKKATIRMADENIIKEFDDKFEIVSLVGTFSSNGCHLHISLSDKNGKVFGGHLKDGCIIHTTAEIIIGELKNVKFSREFDKQTGFKELVISEK